MSGRALLLAIASIAGCRTNVTLGSPETDPTPAVCPATPANVVVALLDPARGELRALAARNGFVVAVFAHTGGSALVAIAPSSGGDFIDLARIGADPVAVAFDGTYAYVACQAPGEVYRVGRSGGEVVVAPAQSAVTSITAGEHGHAYWTRPVDDVVVTWDFAAGKPSSLAIVPRAQSILHSDRTLYVVGAHALVMIDPGAAAPRKLADRCGTGALAVAQAAVFCIDEGTLQRIDVSTGNAVALAGGIRDARDVVVARGRAFFRSAGASGATIESVPIDGIGGPTTIETVTSGPAPIATDGCGLYYAVGSSLNRRAL